MEANGVLLDAFGRISEGLQRGLTGLTDEELIREPHPPIGWLAWRATRVQDSNVARLAGVDQLWIGHGWHARFNMEPNPMDFGRSLTHTRQQVAAFRGSVQQLLDYHEAVHGRTAVWLGALGPEGLSRELDEPQWDPRVTVSVRLVSVVETSLAGVGQINYLRGFHRVGGWFPSEGY